MLMTKEEYAEFVAKKFKLFNLNLELCDPNNLKFNLEQLYQVLEEIQKRIPEHLSRLPLIDITFQAAVEDTITVYLYSPFSSNSMIGFQAKFSSNRLHLECAYERSFSDIRKESLSPEIKEAEDLACNSDACVILVVDDDAVVRSTLKKWLNTINPNFIVIKKENGKEAVVYMQSGHRCDLIFMDMQMPVMRGDISSLIIRRYEKVKQVNNVPIIAMTANSLIKEHLARSGFNLACKKPLRLAAVHQALRFFDATRSLIPESPKTAESNAESNNRANLAFADQDESMIVLSPDLGQENQQEEKQVSNNDESSIDLEFEDDTIKSSGDSNKEVMGIILADLESPLTYK